MADVQFDDLWQSRDAARRVVVEPVPGVHLKPQRRGEGGGVFDARELVFRQRRVADLDRVATRRRCGVRRPGLDRAAARIASSLGSMNNETRTPARRSWST